MLYLEKTQQKDWAWSDLPIEFFDRELLREMRLFFPLEKIELLDGPLPFRVSATRAEEDSVAERARDWIIRYWVYVLTKCFQKQDQQKERVGA